VGPPDPDSDPGRQIAHRKRKIKEVSRFEDANVLPGELQASGICAMLEQKK
jgi:hypothetical protein